MGHEAEVVSPSAQSGTRGRAYVVDGVPVRRVPGSSDFTHPWHERRRPDRSLAHVLGAGRYDVVHVMQPLRLPGVFRAATAVGLPVVAHVADSSYICPRVVMLRADGTRCETAAGGAACAEACGIPAGPARLEWAHRALAGAAAVVSPTRYAIELHAANGFDTAHWHHLPWGVDYALLPPRTAARASGPLVVGFLGTLLRHKGPHVLVEALRRLPEAELRLRLYGDSFHERDYEQALRDAAAGDPRIAFCGSYDHDELRSILGSVDVVALPSLWHENLPTTGLNAVAAGVPVVASDVPGLSELVADYRCGFTFPVGDAGALAALLTRLVDDGHALGAVRATMTYPPGDEEQAWRIERLYARILTARAA